MFKWNSSGSRTGVYGDMARTHARWIFETKINTAGIMTIMGDSKKASTQCVQIDGVTESGPRQAMVLASQCEQPRLVYSNMGESTTRAYKYGYGASVDPLDVARDDCVANKQADKCGSTQARGLVCERNAQHGGVLDQLVLRFMNGYGMASGVRDWPVWCSGFGSDREPEGRGFDPRPDHYL